MIAGDLAMKAADVHIGFLDRFSGALVIYGSGRRGGGGAPADHRRVRPLIKLYLVRINEKLIESDHEAYCHCRHRRCRKNHII